MAKSKATAVNALSGRRLMTKEIMNYLFEMGSPAALWTKEKNGWQNLNGATGTSRLIYNETYYDLSGYEREHLTTFPEKITVQEGGSFRLKEDNASLRFGMVVLDIITEERLSEVDINLIANQIYNQETSPSFNMGPLEFSQCIYGRYRMFGRDTAIYTVANGNMSVLTTTQFGSGSPTTCAKLWIYKIVMPMGALLTDPDDFIVVPPSRYIMSATIAEENDSAYMMRQKNSYELATND